VAVRAEQVVGYSPATLASSGTAAEVVIGYTLTIAGLETGVADKVARGGRADGCRIGRIVAVCSRTSDLGGGDGSEDGSQVDGEDFE
jgi:hypothetical protein